MCLLGNIYLRVYDKIPFSLAAQGYKVMLDRDLAELYGVETRVLNQSVKRNIERFPEDFMFQLTNEEFRIGNHKL
jgi:hypothetical protein